MRLWALASFVLFGVACGKGDDSNAATGSTTTAGDSRCELEGGVCSCAGSCGEGYVLAPADLQTCPQAPDSAGACGLECCLPATETDASTTAMTSTSSESSGSSSDTTDGSTATRVVYVGSDDGDIHVHGLGRDGVLILLETVEAGTNPTFLAVDPTTRWLLAVDEVGDYGGRQTGSVASFAVDPRLGTLTYIDREASEGVGPAHVATDRTGAWVLVANYSGATVAVLPLASDGSLDAAVDVEPHGPGAHPHLSRASADNAFVFVPDLGRDQIVQYVFDDENGMLTPNVVPAVDAAAGDGPRHMDFHPAEPFAYVVNEYADTVTTYAYDVGQGRLEPLQSVDTLPPGVDGSMNTCADIHVGPSGQFVYASNRGHDSIVVLRVEPNGILATVEHEPSGGMGPRNFSIDPDGEIVLVANRNSDNVVAFFVESDGSLTPTGEVTSVPSPAFVGIVALPR